MSGVSTFKGDLSDVIRATIDTYMLDAHFCLPAKVVSYDKDTQYADVEIQLLQGFADGTTDEYPVIPNVPVKHPRAQDGLVHIHMPLKPGDDLILVFSQRSLDAWKAQGGLTFPNDTRKFHATDAFALIGGSAMPDAFTVETDDSIEIVNDQTKMIVAPDGKFSVSNEQGDYVETVNNAVDQTQQGFNELSTDTTNTMFGPTKLNGFETYATIASELSSLLSILRSFQRGS